MNKTMMLNGMVCDVTSLIADRYGVANKTIPLWVARGLLPEPIRIGNRAYYARPLVEQMMGRGEAKA